MLDILTARQLLQMGYKPDEIAALDNNDPNPDPAPDPVPDPVPEPAPDPAPDPTPAPAADQKQVLTMIQQLTSNMDKMQKQLQALAIRDIGAPDIPRKATAEEILSQMLQPYKDNKDKGGK